jgi:hypothetical protein
MSTIPVAVFCDGPDAFRGVLTARRGGRLVVCVHVHENEQGQRLTVPEWRTTQAHARTGAFVSWPGWTLDARELRALRRWVVVSCSAHPPRGVRLLDALLAQPACPSCGAMGASIEAAPGARKLRRRNAERVST